MQQVNFHFNRKKTEFVSFFQSIIQLIQKLSYEIELQIDREYVTAAQEFNCIAPEEIRTACEKMEQDRDKIYHQMIDKLCLTLKSFSSQFDKKLHHANSLSLTNKPLATTSSHSMKVSPFQIEQVESQSMNVSALRNNINTKQSIQYNQFSSKDISDQSAKTPTQARNNEPLHIQTPSPFAQKVKLKKMESSTHRRVSEYEQSKEKEKEKSKQKIQVLKKNDVCQSLDNYIQKEAKEMLQRSQSKSARTNPYNTARRSNIITQKFDIVETQNDKKFNGQRIQKTLENKLGVAVTHNNPNNPKKINPSLISPIHRINID